MKDQMNMSPASQPVAPMLRLSVALSDEDVQALHAYLQDFAEWARHTAVAPSDAKGKADAANAGGLTPLDYRAQGREEALAIILAQSAEDPFSECIGYSRSGAPDDEGGCYWEEEKLRALLHIGDKTHDAYDRAEAAYWDALGHKDEAKREMLFVEQAPFYKPLHDFLRKHEAWDLMGDLKRAGATARSPATSAADAKDASGRTQMDIWNAEAKALDAERAGWEAAAKALSERAEGRDRNGDYTEADECRQCASMLHDMKPARAAMAAAPSSAAGKEGGSHG